MSAKWSSEKMSARNVDCKYDVSLDCLISAHSISLQAFAADLGSTSVNGACENASTGSAVYDDQGSAIIAGAQVRALDVLSNSTVEIDAGTQSMSSASTLAYSDSNSVDHNNVDAFTISSVGAATAAVTGAGVSIAAATATDAAKPASLVSAINSLAAHARHRAATSTAITSVLAGSSRAGDAASAVLTVTSVTDSKWPHRTNLGDNCAVHTRMSATSRGPELLNGSSRVTSPSRSIKRGKDSRLRSVSRKHLDFEYSPLAKIQPKVHRAHEHKSSASRSLHVESEWMHEQQWRTRFRVVRVYPRGVRTKSDNYNPLPCWASGAQLCALNLQTNDLATQLHYALFELNGGCGYVEKPKEMLVPKPCWPQPQLLLKVVTIQPISLFNLPERGEERPHLASSRSRLHDYVSELSFSRRPSRKLTQTAARAVRLLSVSVELYAIGGFHCVSTTLPPMSGETRQVVRTLRNAAGSHSRDGNVDGGVDGGDSGRGSVRNGGGVCDNFHPRQKLHCVAAEPMACVLRVVVVDEDFEQEVAYDTVVLGAMREGFRVIHLRSMLGTRIEGCYLLVHISFSSQVNAWVGEQELVNTLYEQRETIDHLQENISGLQSKVDLFAAETARLQSKLSERDGWPTTSI